MSKQKMGPLTGEDFLNWATSLGFSSTLPPESFEKLLTPQMTSCWRHLMEHVKPKSDVDTIRKNILLKKLQQEKLSDRNSKKLSVKIGQVSQIDAVRTHENLEKTIEKNSAESTTLVHQIEDLNLELKKMGKTKKRTLKSIEENRVKILVFKEKEKHFKKLLLLNDFIKQMKSMSLPLPQKAERPQFDSSFQNNAVSLNLHQSEIMYPKYMEDEFRPPYNSSFCMNPAQQSSELVSAMNQIEQLEGLMEELGPSDIFDDRESRKDKIYSFITDNFKNTPPSVLLEGLTIKLNTLTRELALAATTNSGTEGLNTIESESEHSENGTIEFVKAHWQSADGIANELMSLRKSADDKLYELEKKKDEVVNRMLQTTNGEYKDDLRHWVDTIVSKSLLSEKMRIIEEEIDKINCCIKGLEEFCDMHHELDQAILECQHKIKSTIMQLRSKLTIIKKSRKIMFQNIEFFKKTTAKKILDFKNIEKERRDVSEYGSPFECLRDSIKTVVSMLVKLPPTSLQLVRGPKHIMEDVPHLAMYNPYTPVHLILQDNLEKYCWGLQSMNMLEELQPSSPLDYDVENLIEETNSEEIENNLTLEETIEELNQILNSGKQNIQRSTKSLSFWIDSPVAEYIPQEILIEGYNFKSWKAKVSEYLKEEY